MVNETSAAAFLAFQRRLGAVYRMYLDELAKNTPNLNRRSLNAARTALVDKQVKLAGIFLLPVIYPQTEARIDRLYDQYAAVIGSPRKTRGFTESRQKTRATFIGACMQMLLEGEKVTAVTLSRAAGVPWNVGSGAFDGGMNEVREAAFEQLIAEALKALGIQDSPV